MVPALLQRVYLDARVKICNTLLPLLTREECRRTACRCLIITPERKETCGLYPKEKGLVIHTRSWTKLGWRDYWEEIKWCSVNNSKCPVCHRAIKVNMSRHLRLVHTRFCCYWRCPVPACPSWLSSELNGKDHIENTHRFREECGYSFYECLRHFGLEWFESRSFFDQKKITGQSLWMDLALARRSSKELRNSYTITGSPEFAPLMKYFRATIHQLQILYTGVPDTLHPQSPMLSLCDRIRTDIDTHTNEVTTSSASTPDSLQYSDIQTVEISAPSVDNSPATSLPVDALVRPLTPANRSLRFLESGAFGPPQISTVSSRAAVSGMSIASMDLLSYLDPLPMDRLLLHEARSIRDWPSMVRDQLHAVAHRDIHVARHNVAKLTRHNVAKLTRYLDLQSAHLAACAGAMDDSLPLMTVETFPRLPGGVRATLDSLQ